MASVIVKEREWDTESVRSHRPFATVRRYKIPEEVEEEDTRIIIKERHDHDHRDRDPRVEYRYVERERDYSDSHSHSHSHSHRGGVEEDRIIIRRRSRSRSSSPETRVSVSRDPRQPQSPYSLEKYSKSTEYFSQPAPQPIIIQERAAPAPQPIIIRESAQPQQIIVRERVEPSYELVERPRQREDEADYYYERRVREIDRGRTYDDRYDNEREWRRRREDDRGYHSDDDAVYIRREYEEGYGSREHSPHHRRHIAEGVIAGIAASQIVRHHRKHEGRSPGGRLGQLVGYGALGGIGAEALTRFNDRDRSRSRGREDVYRGRGRSRSRSLPKAKTLAGVAALAGLSALAYAAGKKNSNNKSRSRSRRHRSSSRGRSVSSGGKHTDPKHRNNRVAQAGLVGAAAAGLAEAARSRSRGGRSRSRSRVRTGVPIVAAGLGSAAVAGLYERHKGKKEAKEASRSRSRSYSRSRSRSRSHSRSVSRHAPRRAASDTALVEYGGDPIPSSELDHHRSYSRGRHHRHRSSSSGSSPGRRRSRSRSKGLAEVAAAAGVAGVAAHEVTKRRERRRERERRRQEEEAAATAGAGTDTNYPSTTDLNNPYYPSSNQFAPPPQAPYNGYLPPQHPNPSYDDSAYASGSIPAYNPAAYGPTTGPTLPHDDPYINPAYAPPHPNQYEQPHPDPYLAPRTNDPRNPENVSATRGAHLHSGPDGLDGGEVSPRTITPGSTRAASPVSPATSTSPVRRPRSKSVQFDADPVESEHIITPDISPQISRDDGHNRRHRHSDHNPSRKRRRQSRSHSPAGEEESDTTEDLPPRFDEQGRRLPERGGDPFADKIEDLLHSDFFQSVAENLVGVGSSKHKGKR